MALTESAIYSEVDRIFKTDNGNAQRVMKTVIRCNGKDNTTMKTLSLDIDRQYATNYADVTVAQVTMGLGDFLYDVYPYKANLEVTVYFFPAGTSDSASISKATSKTVYRGLLVETQSDIMESNAIAGHDRFSLNIGSLKTFHLQLVDLTTEWVRMEQVGSVFKNISVGELCWFLLTQQSKRVKITADNAIRGCEIVVPDNKDIRANVPIPHGTPLVKIPQLLQDQYGGLYSTGLGYYLQSSQWYVYPLYNLTRFDRALKTLTVINVPKNKLPGAERTYRKTANQVIVIATGSSKHNDQSEGQIANTGNGARYVESRHVIDGAVTVSNNKMVFDRSKGNSEFINESRETGLNHAPVAPGRIHGSGFNVLSEMARKKGSVFIAEWENADPDLLIPGMPVKVLYMDHNKAKEKKGILLGAHVYYSMVGAGMTSLNHHCTVMLTIFTEKNVS